MVVVRELAGAVHGRMERTGTAGCLLVMAWVLLLLLLLLHSRSWSAHVIRMVVVVVVMASGIHMGCGHAGLGLWHLATVHTLVDVVGRRLLGAVIEVGLVVQRGWTIAMLLLLLLLLWGVSLTWELSREALLRVSHYAVRSGGRGFL